MSTTDTYAPPALIMATVIAVFLIWGDLADVTTRVILAVLIVMLAGWCFLAGASAMDEEDQDSLSG